MATRPLFGLLAAAVLIAGCRGPSPTSSIPPAAKTGSRINLPGPSARRPFSAAGTYGFYQSGDADTALLNGPTTGYLFYLCANGQTTQAGCTASVTGTHTLNVIAAASADPCVPLNGSPVPTQGNCSAGLLVNSSALNHLGVSAALKVKPRGSQPVQLTVFDQIRGSDTMTVTSSDLPDGTPVNVDEQITLTGTSTCGGFLGFRNVVVASAAGALGAFQEDQCTPFNVFGPAVVIDSAEGTFNVGQSYPVSFQVGVRATASDAGDAGPAVHLSPDAIAMHDIRATDALFPEDSDVTLVFASGGATF